MLRDTLVSRIGRRFGFRTDLDATIQDELLNAQVELEEELVPDLPWFLLSEVSNVNGVALEERLPLPSDFLMENEDGTLWIYDSTIAVTDDQWLELRKGYHDALKAEYTGTGRPLRYALLGEYFRLYPTPDQVYNYRMLYYQRDTVLSSNIENKWLKFAPWVLGGRAGFNLAQSLDHENALQFFSTKYAESALSLEKRNRAREEANNDSSLDDMEP